MAAVDVLLPRVCIVCGRRLNLNEKYLCLHCISDLPITRFWVLEHNPMADRFNELIQKKLEKSEYSTSSREHYALAAALVFYDSDGEYRHIPYQIKYHGNISAGRFFGKLLAERLQEAEWFSDADTIIPVPLHWRRKWKRGYNQAEIIADTIARHLDASLRTDILKRSRHTETQTKLGLSDKEKNVSGAFVINDKCSDISGINHILLVDDVFTTGSTALACFIALRAVFPPSVRISVATLGFVGE